MAEFSVVDHMKIDLSKSLLVLGFPSVGLVGSIASAYLVDTLKMPHVASVVSEAFPPMAAVRSGVSLSPMRAYLTGMVCGLDGECDQLGVWMSDLAPRVADVAAVSFAVLRWAQDRGAREIVVLDGLRSDGGPQGAKPDLWGVASDPDRVATVTKVGARPLLDGVLSGFAGIAVYQAGSLGLGAMSLLVETSVDFPDARGAARLVEALRPLLPHIQPDPKPLYEQAEAIEKHMRASAEKHGDAVAEITAQSDVMYG